MTHNDSAVDFVPANRIHLALGCRDLEQSASFYQRLFGVEPTKRRADYVKFEVAEPALNLTLNPEADPVVPPAPEHFGVQVKSTAEVQRRAAALEGAGLPLRREAATTCCYAVQDKAWVQDPDGRRWEIFVVTEADTSVHSVPTEDAPRGACCQPG